MTNVGSSHVTCPGICGPGGLHILGLVIVNRGEWLGSPANFKGTDKGDNMDVE